MTLPTLKNAYTSSQITELETLIDNKVASSLSAGVYLVKVNGNIVRYDTISDTPIQDAINAAETAVVSKDSVLLVNYECGPANLGFNGKMEQNIVLKNDVNLYAIGNTKLFSNSTDNTPMFTDGGNLVQVFFVGYWNMVRYGGAGANNRCGVRTTNAGTQIYFPDFVVVDSSNGSTNSFDCTSLDIGMGFWTGAIKINGGKSVINSDPILIRGLTVTGGEVDYYGKISTLTISNGTVNTYNDIISLTLSGGIIKSRGNIGGIVQSGGILYLYGSTNTSCFNSGGVAYIYNSILNGGVSSTSAVNLYIYNSIVTGFEVGGTSTANVYVYNSIINGLTVSGTSTVNLYGCNIGFNSNDLESQVEVGGENSKVILEGCRIIGSDVYGLLGVGVKCSNGKAIVSNCTIVMTDIDLGGVFSLQQTGTGVIKNYNSISNTATSGTIGVMALTVNAAVE
jgi:hypothetical protein